MGLEGERLRYELKPREEEEYQPDEREGSQPEQVEPSPEAEEAARRIARKDLC